jgi:hypothetical protein
MDNGLITEMDMPPIAVVGPQKPELSAAPAYEPKNRWECTFVWQFITRFTTLRGKVEGLDNIAECVSPPRSRSEGMDFDARSTLQS